MTLNWLVEHGEMQSSLVNRKMGTYSGNMDSFILLPVLPLWHRTGNLMLLCITVNWVSSYLFRESKVHGAFGRTHVSAYSFSTVLFLISTIHIRISTISWRCCFPVWNEIMEEPSNQVAVKEARYPGPKAELALQSNLITVTGAGSPPTQKWIQLCFYHMMKWRLQSKQLKSTTPLIVLFTQHFHGDKKLP